MSLAIRHRLKELFVANVVRYTEKYIRNGLTSLLLVLPVYRRIKRRITRYEEVMYSDIHRVTMT